MSRDGVGYPSGTSTAATGEIELTPTPREDYGRSEKDPIKVGGSYDSGSENEQRYLSALRGPEGQPVRFERRGSCCPFATPNSELGGMLDVFEVTYDGLEKPIMLYVNMYDADELYVPAGFTAAR